MSNEAARIKEKLGIIEFLRDYLDLRPAGKNWKALCPFHSERTPSFIVSPERQTWHCFGSCGEGGDIFKFLMQYEHIEFYEALAILAEKAGIPLERLSPREQKEFGVLYDIHVRATALFQAELQRNREALDYLLNRGLKKETIEEFSIGFCPPGDTVTSALLRAGFSVADLNRAGVSIKMRNNLERDKFEKRITFPIRNTVGKIAAFTGRILPKYDDPNSAFPAPKYLNSPETPIFNKSKVLYGLDKTKKAIAENKAALFVEGQMDLLMAWQCGVKNVVAVSGTDLTAHHLAQLRRIADTIIAGLDNDAAGLKALERGLEIFSDFDFYVKVINLGQFKDPADACKENPSFLGEAMAKAEPGFTVLFQSYWREAAAGDIAKKKRVIRHLLKKVRRLKSPTERAFWIADFARISGYTESALSAELETIPLDPVAAVGNEERRGEIGTTSEQELSKTDSLAERLCLLAARNDKYRELLRMKLDLLPERHRVMIESETSSPEWETLTMRAAAIPLPDDTLANEWDGLIRALETERLRAEQYRIKLELRTAESSGNEEKCKALLDEFDVVTKKLHKTKNP